jgi:glycosyltransferase involved in cell wall biosynthesis
MGNENIINGLPKMKISLILPVYNPSDGWADIVVSNVKEIKQLYPAIEFETIVVNDGSTIHSFSDGKNKLTDSNIKLMEYAANRGKGEALRIGVEASSGGLVIYTDIDFPYTIESMSCMIDTLREEVADIVIGVKDSSYYTHVPLMRRLISRLFRFFVRLFLQIPTDDTQCGLKGFDQKGKSIFLRTTINRYLFDLEFVYMASRDKDIRLKIQEIKLREDVVFRKMNFSIIRTEAWNFLKMLLKP